MEDKEPVVCASCGAEPDDALKTEADLTNEGWGFDGEYGPNCPECVAPADAGSTAAGIQDALADFVQVTEKPTKPKKAKGKPKSKSKPAKRAKSQEPAS